MKVLAIETSTLTGSIALLSDREVIGEITLSVSLQHSERLMPAIADLLRDATVAPSEIDLYGVATGPGSFTGLRIGLAAAQGLALAHGRPVIGVSTLEGLAFHGVHYPAVIVPMLNAYRNELYWGLYRGEKGMPKGFAEDRVSPVEEVISRICSQSEKCLLLGDGLKVYGERLLKDLDGRVDLAPVPFQHPKASHIACIARQRFEEGVVTEPLPRYLRRPG